MFVWLSMNLGKGNFKRLELLVQLSSLLFIKVTARHYALYCRHFKGLFGLDQSDEVQGGKVLEKSMTACEI